MNTILRTLLLAAVALIAPALATAAPDFYVGDTAIYGGAPANVDPNVVILFDTSLSMNDATLPENPYDPGTTYAAASGCGGQPCVTNTVYKCTAFGLECGNWTTNTVDVSTVTTSCPVGTNPKNSLLTTGQWNSSRKKLQTSGACASGNGIYALGNWINWRSSLPPGAFSPKIDIAKQVVTDLLNSTTGIRFSLFDFNNNQGAKVLDGSNGYRATVKDMDALFDATTTNRDALVYAVNKDIVADSWTPLAESLYEVGRYYQGKVSAFTTESWTSPIQASCQKNYVIIVTDGMSTADQDNVLKTICNNGDCDGDGFEPANDPAKTYPNQGSDYLDDVAKYLHDTDVSTTFDGTQNVITFTVGFGLGGSNAGAVKLLSETAANGGGKAYLSNSASELSTALQQILGQIMEVNSSFVAPVVPVSPENRTYSSGRVYLGFFKPQSGTSMWLGNLKKYGINDTGVVVDSTGTVSNYVDRNRDGKDDNTGATLPSGATDGSFKATAASYWTSVPDGGDVDNGGAGEVLLNRDFASNPRKIYTYTGTNVSLTDASNAVTTTNAAITPAMVGVATAADHDKLIKYVHGWDSYDADVDGVVDE
ncbi:MAG TPA: vWA domain-containing protein, partial [Nitrospiria bacterium]|nr:vWA domain-containing protein [Nitrospiria bacterium]